MSLKYAIKNVERGTWYKQGGAVVPFFIFVPYLCMYEEIGHDNVFVINKGTWDAGYFEKIKEKKKAEIHIRKYLADTSFLDNRIKKWRKAVKKQQKKLKQITTLKFNEDKKLKKLVKEYAKLTVSLWQLTLVIEDFDPWGEQFIKRYASKYNLSDDEIAVLTSPDKLTYVQKEVLDRFKIVKSKRLDKVKEHYREYYWYLTSWQHAIITSEEYFRRLVKENIKNFDDFKKKVEEVLKHIKYIKENKKKIIKKHKIDKKTQKVFKFFSKTNNLRDERKRECVGKINYELWLFLKKLSKYNKVGLELLLHIKIDELESFKLSKDYLKTLKKRTKDYYVMYYNEKDRLSWLYGEDADKVFNALEKKIIGEASEIKGRVAYQGVVKGKVKIVNSINEFSKVKKGDIIVSIMTRPEMVPVLKRAAAIVTDEGGMTCHAAIVSRELKKPCIVGTDKATAVLKDGDLVEVDADKGVVKIIKRREK